MENLEQAKVLFRSSRFWLLFLMIILIVSLLYPILLIFAPLSFFYIFFYPLWSIIQSLTILIISFTGFDVWISRGIALAIYSFISSSLVGIIGSLIGGGYKYFFKRKTRLYVTFAGCIFCVAMYLISKNVNFNPINGEPLKKYYKYPDGRIELFPIEMNFHPLFGDSLITIDKTIILRYNNLSNKSIELQEQKQKQVPSDTDNHTLNVTSISKNIDNNYEDHINSSINNTKKYVDISVVIVDNKNNLSNPVSSAIADIYTRTGKRANIGLIKNTFIHEPIFRNLFDGNSGTIQTLKLNNHVGFLALGYIDFSSEHGMLVDQTIICKASLKMNIISIMKKSICKSFSLSTSGNGVSEGQAREDAYEKLIDKYKDEYSTIEGDDK